MRKGLPDNARYRGSRARAVFQQVNIRCIRGRNKSKGPGGRCRPPRPSGDCVEGISGCYVPHPFYRGAAQVRILPAVPVYAPWPSLPGVHSCVRSSGCPLWPARARASRMPYTRQRLAVSPGHWSMCILHQAPGSAPITRLCKTSPDAVFRGLNAGAVACGASQSADQHARWLASSTSCMTAQAGALRGQLISQEIPARLTCRGPGLPATLLELPPVDAP